MLVTLPKDHWRGDQQRAYAPISLFGTNCVINSQVPLAPLTSYRVGGPAEWYVAPKKMEELQAAVEWANSEGLPVTLLGAGSNLLISDQGLPGLVISTRHLRHINFDAEQGLLTVGPGESLPRLAWLAAKRGWEGLEWAVGIPGTVGGAVVMNAGAHTSCTAKILFNTQILTTKGDLVILTPKDLNYTYRTSILQGSSQIVTQATFQLQPGANIEVLMALTTEHLHSRRASQPYNMPSCGSVFRNPGNKTAGWLIEQTGLKGYQIGGAQVAHRHANFILNCGWATASDIFNLILHVQEQVKEQWNHLLHPEVKILGEF